MRDTFGLCGIRLSGIEVSSSNEGGRIFLIPNTIHYCWFGRGEKPQAVLKCIESWKEYLPDFIIKEWNEDCFDIDCNLYVRQAYDSKKYAFVSDYARFWVLYKYGGLYLDTDVEIIKPFGSLFADEAFAGHETRDFVAPGLVLWCKSEGNEMVKEMLHVYETAHFINEDGSMNTLTVCVYFTEILQKHGFIPGDEKQQCGSFTIYPKEYFCPFDDLTGIMNITENTVSIHWYAKTWMNKKQILGNKISRVAHRMFGVHFFWDIKQKLKSNRSGSR